jgi:hypothetical protein
MLALPDQDRVTGVVRSDRWIGGVFARRREADGFKPGGPRRRSGQQQAERAGE